ncbi:hypothetical protein [Hansschlegelia sp. KR7-227]|uniref:hypothetical protein n=1 Tax=Hansschlegelia sp. KR7-227 TaxID=3400914 RepID=UPI003C029280
MRYLGTISCKGVLTSPAGGSARASLEIECFQNKGGMLTSSGELEADPHALALAKGQNDVRFVTDDGHELKLMLTSDKKGSSGGPVAHVVASGDLPSVHQGSLSWPAAIESTTAETPSPDPASGS